MRSGVSLILLLFFSLLPLAYSQELYKYVDENGDIYIVDSPYKLPDKVKNKDKYIKEYEKEKKEKRHLPPDLQDTRPAYHNVTDQKNIQAELKRIEEEKNRKQEEEARKKKIEELKKKLDETIKELGYKSQRALITQIPDLKAEVEKLKAKIEEYTKEIERLSNPDNLDKKN